MLMQHVKITLNRANIRHDRMEGRDFIVAPMVMLTEGVHAGSKGPLYYPADELAKPAVVSNWNMKPVVVYHPTINGQGVSACDADIVDRYKIGVVMNTRWDGGVGKLRAEAWIEVDRANAVDDRIMKAVDDGQPMELSTGVFTEDDDTPGEWNGEAYDAIARNYHADHLALLPDQKGACSMADGAGFLVCNAITHGDIRNSLGSVLRERFGVEVWIVDVFDAAVVYDHDGKLWKLMYSKPNDVVSLAAEAPVEVRRNVQYRTVAGALIGNADFPVSKGERTMTKKELVDGLIANKATSWSEEDRAGLMAMDESQLQKMAPVEQPAEPAPTGNEEKVAAAAGGAGVQPAANDNASQQATQPAQPLTLEQLPPEMQAVYNHGLTKLQQERAELIATITGNAGNKFTAEQLNAMPLDTLQGIAALATNGAPQQPAPQQGNPAVALFTGQGVPATNVQGQAAGEHVEEPLGLPTMNFEEQAAAS